MSTPDQSHAQPYMLSDVRHDRAGFESLVRLYAALKTARFANLEIGMRHVACPHPRRTRAQASS